MIVKTNHHLARNENGTALIESCVVILTIATVIFLIAFVSYFFFAKVKISNIGYNSVICLAERQKTSTCLKLGKRDLKASLPFGELKIFDLRKYQSRFRVKIRWDLVGNNKIVYDKRLRY